MRRLCFILVLFVFFGFGVSRAVSAEDVPETMYDESEGLPYESTPLFPIVPLAVARKLQSLLSAFRLEVGVPSPFKHRRVNDTDAHPSAGARVSLVLLC